MKTEIGHYTVDGKMYASKFDAVMAAKNTNSEIEWNFFDDKFSKVNWYAEPVLSLDELYRIRAQQIRDQYDYIIVFCSGGSDSNNVIRTFLKNNIHIDEVVGLAPMSGLKNWDFDPTNLNEDNTISETKLALFPMLNEISVANPKIKLTINDFFESIVNYKDDDWTYQSCGNIVTVLTSHFTDVLKFPHIDKLLQQGKRIGLVYGTDKPIIRISETGNLYFVFADSGINYLNMPEERANSLIDRVLFYWSADLPELLVKQAHVVAKAITLPQYKYIREYLAARPKSQATGSFQDVISAQEQMGINPITKHDILNKYLNKGNIQDDRRMPFTGKTIYQREIVPFIYPTTYTKELFQCQKVDADAGFFTQDQAWLQKLHNQSRVSEMVTSGIKTLYNSIPARYLNINGTGFANHIKVYHFGKLPKSMVLNNN
jgi:hypothetical protein